MKNLIYIPTTLLLAYAILYPFWIYKGYLGFEDAADTYGTIGAAVAIYGGLTACILAIKNIHTRK